MWRRRYAKSFVCNLELNMLMVMITFGVVQVGEKEDSGFAGSGALL